MTKLSEIRLDNLLGGAGVERFAHEFAAVLENIQDVNTPADAKREVTLKVVIRPQEDRQSGIIELHTSKKLAPLKPVAGPMHVGMKDGRIVGVAFDPRQNELFPDARDPQITPLPQRSAEG